MKNAGSVIALYNKYIVRHKATNLVVTAKESCPLQKKEIFETEVTNITDNGKREYFGASNTTFKERYHNNTLDFNFDGYSKSIECRNTFGS